MLPVRSFRPPPPELSRPEVVEGVYDRTHFFTTLSDTSARLRVVRDHEDGRERFPSVGGVLVFDRMVPGVWLRGERLGQRAFELRATGESFWLELPQSREVVTGGGEAYERMPHLVRPEEVLLWLAPPDWLGLSWDSTEMEVTPDEYVFEVKLDGFPLRRVKVDRYGLHINAIETYDLLGNVDTRVEMDRYRAQNGRSFPHRFTVFRPGSGYEISLRLGSPRFGQDIPEETFQARERRGWQHIDLDRDPVPDTGDPERILGE